MNTLAEETPFAAVVKENRLSVACSSCFALKRDATLILSRCIGCRVLYYCSRECQQKDWVNHKKECQLLKKFSPRVPDAMTRLMARTILKLEKSDAQDAAFNGRRYEDLMDHHEEIVEDVPRMRSLFAVANTLLAYMGEKLMPKPDDLLSIYGKICTNSISICDEPTTIGIGLYIGLSAQNHSCDPDAYVIFEGNKAILRSSRMTEYSKDVTITYVDLLFARRDRQENLRSKYYFTCTCSVCSDPTREFLENSVRSTCCADSYCLLDPSRSQLSCFNCGAPSKVTVEQAISANRIVRYVCDDIEQAHASNSLSSSATLASDNSSELDELIKKHDTLSKVLSPFNLGLLGVADKIFGLSYQLRDYRVSVQYSDCILPAYRKYLPVGHPVFTARLICVAMAMYFGSAHVRKTLKIVEEAQEASRVTFGSPNKNSELELVKSTFRMQGIQL